MKFLFSDSWKMSAMNKASDWVQKRFNTTLISFEFRFYINGMSFKHNFTNQANEFKRNKKHFC